MRPLRVASPSEVPVKGQDPLPVSKKPELDHNRRNAGPSDSSPEAINRQYKELMKKPISDVRKIYERSHRVSDTRGVPKMHLVTDILIARHGQKAVDRAFK